MQVAYGRWLTDGYPQVILFDLGSAAFRLNDWKRELWDQSNIGIHADDKEANDAVLFGALVAEFLGIVSVFHQFYLSGGRISGAALIF